MGISFSSDFLFGIVTGVLLVLLGQPLGRSLGRMTRWVPFMLFILAIVIGIILWRRWA